MRLIRGARYIVGSRGSALFLNFFAKPGAKLCIFQQHMLKLTSVTCLFEELGIDTTVLSGPIVNEHKYAQFAEYSISEDTFCAFLDNWLA